MLIVSQDGTEVFNFDRVTNTWIDTDVLDSKGEVFEICADGETLGYYKTEERAKEVLEEIVECYLGVRAIENIEAELTFEQSNEVRNRPKCYYMPKE